MFAIALADDMPEGRIVIGDFTETFHAERGLWRAADYHASWRRTAALVLEQGFGRFLVSVGPPGEAVFTTYPCWRRGDAALVQKSILLATLTCDFARPEAAESYDPAFSEKAESGGALSTWRCSLRDIAEFERMLQGQRAH
jgi:CdiI N-terminal domain